MATAKSIPLKKRCLKENVSGNSFWEFLRRRAASSLASPKNSSTGISIPIVNIIAILIPKRVVLDSAQGK